MFTTSTRKLERESETPAQRRFEDEIMQQQYPQERVRLDQQHLSGQYPIEETSGHGIKGKLKGFWNKTVVPAFPEAIGDISLFKATLSMEAGIAMDSQDIEKHPEVGRVAEVRRGADLSPEEIDFRRQRGMATRLAFCKYLDLDVDSVHPDDVPIVAFGGSGGGYRAMIGVLGYCQEMKTTGLWDLLTYVAGVSGACWSLAAYYTWAQNSMTNVIDHCKKRLAPFHPLSPEAVRAVLNSKGGVARTLGPLVQKHRSGLETVAMDLYSVFTTGYLFLPNDPVTDPRKIGFESKGEKIESSSHESWLKWTSAAIHLDGGREPLPLLTAIRHERPWKDWDDETHPFKEADPTGAEHSEAQNAWFQWFEISPYEVGCDELQAFVPTWGFGRPFESGRSVKQLPEQSLALLLGLCTSAPAGPLTSYLATINRNLPSGFIGSSITNLSRSIAKTWGKQGTEEFQQHHPLHACNEHNFLYHLNYSPHKAAPPGIENSPRIHLIDSGMDNNCPTYILLRPERKVDVIINMDASSDVQKDCFQERLDQMGARRSLKFAKRHPGVTVDADERNPDRYKGLYAQIYDGALVAERPATVKDSYGHEVDNPPAAPCRQECIMVNLPLLPNETAAKGFDPSTTKFSGSYNLVWTQEQVQMLVDVCRANYQSGEATIKEALWDAYHRKKAKRERGTQS
jgi:cytosolic phospholipase A2